MQIYQNSIDNKEGVLHDSLIFHSSYSKRRFEYIYEVLAPLSLHFSVGWHHPAEVSWVFEMLIYVFSEVAFKKRARRLLAMALAGRLAGRLM